MPCNSWPDWMRVSARLVLGASIASLTASALAGAPAASSSRDPAVPIEPYERIVPMANGCSRILHPGEDFEPDRHWIGGCRFGLIHGPGLTQSLVDGKLYFGRLKAHYGRVVPERSRDEMRLSLPRGPGRESSGFVTVMKSLDDAIRATTGIAAFQVLAMSIDGGRDHAVYDTLWIYKAACPIPSLSSPLDEQLKMVGAGVPMSAADRHILTPLCEQAIERLKSEQRVSGPVHTWPPSPFEKAQYGYFYVIYSEQKIAPLKDNQYQLDTGARVISDVRLCPRSNSVLGCDIIWRAAQQPFIDKYKAMSASFDRLAAADRAARSVRFKPLENELRAKLRRHAAAAQGAQRQGKSATTGKKP